MLENKGNFKVAEVDFDLLRQEIKDAARAAFGVVRRNHSDEQFYAFALYSDESAMTVCPAANTEEGLARRAEEYGYSKPQQLASLRWATGEWAYEFEGAEFFDRACALINGEDRYEGEADEDPLEESEAFVAFRTQVFEVIVLALEDLDAEGFFGAGDAREAITLFCTLSDFDEAGQIEADSARRLNPASVYERFAAERNSE